MTRFGDDEVDRALDTRDDDWNLALKRIFDGKWQDCDGLAIPNSAVGPAHARREPYDTADRYIVRLQVFIGEDMCSIHRKA